MTTLQEGVEAMTHADAHFIKRNKGEWFESWAVLKILAEGRISTLRVSDGTVSKTDSSVLVNALRTGRSGQVIDYVLERDEDGRPTRLSICESGTTTTLTDPISIDVVRQDFAAFEEALMEAESNASGTFSVKGADELFAKYLFGSGKSPSSLKQDCELSLIALDGQREEMRGFSIKSYTGGSPTLFNSSQGAAFRYRLGGHTADTAKQRVLAIQKKNVKSWVVARVNALNDLNAFTADVWAENPVFAKNLSLLDTNMGTVIGHLLRIGRSSAVNKGNLKEALEQLIKEDPLGLGSVFAETYYGFRVRHFLRAAALGMTPATPWDGNEDAEGGMLVVSADRELYCLLAGKSEFERYLIETTYFDTPSTSRLPGYAEIEENAEGVVSFKLHLQIRERDPFRGTN
jgi:hypothetical protein